MANIIPGLAHALGRQEGILDLEVIPEVVLEIDVQNPAIVGLDPDLQAKGQEAEIRGAGLC